MVFMGYVGLWVFWVRSNDVSVRDRSFNDWESSDVKNSIIYILIWIIYIMIMERYDVKNSIGE